MKKTGAARNEWNKDNVKRPWLSMGIEGGANNGARTIGECRISSLSTHQAFETEIKSSDESGSPRRWPPERRGRRLEKLSPSVR